MANDLISPLSGWSDFNVIVGSAGAALTGLQFVVVALAADRRRITEAGARAFATPNIVHFCAVLLISALFTAPWRALHWPALGVKLCGIAGFVYTVSVFRHARRQKDYEPVLEDWIWHFAIPSVVYAGLLASAAALPRHPDGALFGVGLLQIVLLFTGIHNAWDSAVYIAVDGAKTGPQ